MSIHPNFVKQILRETGCLESVLEDGRRAVEEVAPLASALLSDGARKAMEELYVERMVMLYRSPLFEEVKVTLPQYDGWEALALEGKNRSAFEAAGADAARRSEGGRSGFFRQKYPLFGIYEDRMRENFVRSMRLFLERLSLGREKISQSLTGGKDFGKVTGLSSDGADLHCGGQQVLRVTTGAGNFYYKPHDCGMDAFFHDLVEEYFPECTEVPKVVEGEGHGFVSELVRKDLPREEAAGDYFFHFGILMAIFHGLGSADMHYENILACGTLPSAVDLEMLLTPRASFGAGREKAEKGNQDLRNSVVPIGILPHRKQKLSLTSSLYHCDSKAANLPACGGKSFTVEGFEGEFARGFREGYRRVMSCREEIASMIRGYRNLTVRYLVRNTSYYAYLRLLLFRASSMASREAQEKVLAKLQIPFDAGKTEFGRSSITACEKNSLLQGDIPYFCVAGDGHALCGGAASALVQEGYFDQSPVEHLRLRLSRLSHEECRFEEDMIRSFLRHVPADEPAEAPVPLSRETVRRERLEQEVGGILRELSVARIRRTDGISLWQSVSLPFVSALSVVAFDMWADVAGFCAMARKDHPSAEELLPLCVEGLREQAKGWSDAEGELLQALSMGLYSGVGGSLMACVALVRAGIAEGEALAEEFLRLVEEKALYRARETGTGYGVAGLLLSLVSLKKQGICKGARLNAMIGKTAEELAGRELPKAAGGARGMGGIGAALASAYGCTGELSFAMAAAQIFRKVREAYREDLAGWPEPGENMSWLAERAPWAAGIACHAMTALEDLAGTDEASAAGEVRDLALASLCAEETLLWRDSLHEGNALAVLCLMKAFRQLGDMEYRARAGRLLAAMLERRERKGSFSVMPKGIRSFFDCSFFLGTLGIGAAILCYLSEVCDD